MIAWLRAWWGARREARVIDEEWSDWYELVEEDDSDE